MMKSTKFALTLLVLALILIIGMGIRVRGIITTHQERAINRPLEDDSYFYFSLGRHIANGDGAMIDDRHLTTGFQPLWGAIVAGVFLMVEENSLAISMVQLVGALIGAVGCVLVYDLTRRITQAEWGALGLSALWFWSPQSVRVQLNGMETGIATVMCIALFYVTYRAYHARKWRWHIAAAMVFGIAFMTRIDTGLLIAPCALVLILLAPPKKWIDTSLFADTNDHDSPFTPDFERQLVEVSHIHTVSSSKPFIGKIGFFIVRRMRVGVVMVLVACVFVIPWVLFTQSINKPILPESGDAVRAASLYVYPDPPPQPVFSVMTENTPRFLDYYGGWTADFTRSLASQVWAIAPLSDKPTYPADPVDHTRLSEYAYLFIGAVILMLSLALINGDNGFRGLAIIYIVWWMSLTAAYVLVIYGIWYFARYSYPLAEMISVLVFIALIRMAHHDKKRNALHRARRSGTSSMAMLVKSTPRIDTLILSICVALAMAVVMWGHIQRYLYDDNYTWIINGADSLRQDGWDMALAWLDANVADDALVGSVFASGVIGFHAQQDVINLDGKVNREAYEALIAGQMWAYVCRAGVDYTVDWGLSTENLLINRAPRDIWREDNMPIVAEFPTESVASVQIRQVNKANCAIMDVSTSG